MDNRAIGVFDSGLGGLTAVRELRRLLPNENIVYFGDTGRVPYGSRGKEVIARYAHQDIRFLQSHDVKMIVCACGTVSSVLGKELNEEADPPSTGVLLPAAQAACARSLSGRIGIIGTAATVQSAAFEKALLAIQPNLHITATACPLFVSLVENGWIDEEDPVTVLTVRRYLAQIKQAGVDTLILGCTHFPLLAPIIQKELGDHVHLIDSGRETALLCAQQLGERDGLADKNTGRCSFYVSDRAEGFSRVAEIFLGRSVQENVQTVPPERMKQKG